MKIFKLPAPKTVAGFCALIALVLFSFSPALANPAEKKLKAGRILKPVIFMAKNVFLPGQALAAALDQEQTEEGLSGRPEAPAENEAEAAATQTVAGVDDTDFIEEHSTVWLDDDSKVCLNYDYDQGNLLVMLKSKF